MNLPNSQEAIKIISEIIKPNGYFPNNNHYPLLIYKSVFNGDLAAASIKKLLKLNNWENAWVNGIYDYHHYHSNTHEVLVILAGCCEVIYGGPNGKVFKLTKGDVVIHPAGVSHKNENASDDFSCVGAYPAAIDYDMCYGKKEEHPQVELAINNVVLPKMDPVFGANGKIFQYWS